MNTLTLFSKLNTSDTIALVGLVIVILGVAFGICKFIVNQLYKHWDANTKISDMHTEINQNIKPELLKLRTDMNNQAKEIRDKLAEILQTLTLKQVSEAHSPRALNEFGKQVRDQSGIIDIVTPKLEQIIETVQANEPENAYQVQEMLLDIMQDLKNEATLKNDIEQAAFKSGVSVETVLLVAGIEIRDTVLDKLNMAPEDIDGHDKAAQK